MAIFTIKSGNKDLSFVIKKNPESGIFLKSLKNGMLFSWFPKGSTSDYIIYFKDASDKITYKVHPDESFEYLNASKYNDARFIADVIQNILHTAREGNENTEKYDVPSNHMITINLVNTDFKTIDIFKRHFSEVEIRYEKISKDNFNISFTTEYKMRLQHLLRIVNLFGIFAQLNSPTYSYLTEDLIEKYIRIANEIDAPYFIRYLIKMRMCRSLNVFNSVKTDLEKSNKNIITLKYGDTHTMRINWVKEILDDKLSIIDIGTGRDYQYLRQYASKLDENNLTYYAIERDADARERIKAGIRNKNLETCVEVYESLEEFLLYHNEYLKNEKFNVLCTEVLEHNEFSQAKKIMKKVCKNIDFENFVITVPNKNFNQFYCIENESFRHDDHKWEATGVELEGLVRATESNVNAELFNVGDIVDGIPTTYGLLLTKIK